MKLADVKFINPIQCGGIVPSANIRTAVDPSRVGSQPVKAIELREVQGLPCVYIQLEKAGKMHEAYSPITNVSSFIPLVEEKKPEVKK